MVIIERVVGDVTVLDLSGPLTFGEATDRLRERIDGLVERDTQRLVLNMTAVPRLDSSGLGELLRTRQLLLRAAGSMRLSGLGPSVRRTLELTRVLGRFEILDSEDAAVKGSATPTDP